jgi:pimeloyl-ACP methyl ester carboxylesterase
MRVGVEEDRLVRNVLVPVRGMANRRRLVVLNRWAGLPEGLTLADLAVRYADAITELGAPVDVLGVSTGGSIAQLLAAEHPQVVRRLALLSTGCRLSPEVLALQAEVARLLGQGATRSAVRLMAGAVAPPAVAPLSGWVGWLMARRLVPEGRPRSDLRLTLEAEEGFDLARCSGPIQAPTLVVGGERDRFYPRWLFEETARMIPHSQLLLRPRRGHVSVASDHLTIAHLTGFFTTA